ncbi:hypothetical protein [Ruminiclostridium josui]|uniref:hypothetical protein n=1 Tax=Ruminiclostridium josui TaxID=1499 RepID=UPI000467C252|nr:hypothetical protein [Ruminiclostridium josui]
MRTIKKRGRLVVLILSVVISLYCIFIWKNVFEASYTPKCPQVDISCILNKNKLSKEDYSLLFKQTGLSKTAIDEFRLSSDGNKKILSIQNNYFKRNKIFREKLNPFTVQESILVNGSISRFVQMAPVKNGDILLTKSCYTFYWRHGHCGIVIDAKKGITLEALTPGSHSITQDISKWQCFPTLKILRLKNADQTKLDAIASFAAKNLAGIKYGIFSPKCYDDTKPKVENCSQMIWQAFYQFGYDIDANKGLIVTPSDIAESELFEVVQTFGFPPDKSW